MKAIRLLLFCCCMYVLEACHSHIRKDDVLHKNSESTPGQVSLSFVLTELKEQNKLPTLQRLTLPKDPLYGKSKVFEGFYLKDFLDSLVNYKIFVPNQTQVIFICTDGYTSSIGLAEILAKNPFVAVHDRSSPDGGDWEKVREQTGKLISPKPFYMVWTQPDAQNVREYPWPYNLMTIEIVPNQLAYGASYPKNSKTYGEGFFLFKNNCMSCHSVKNVGGNIGPDLSAPNNILSRWERKELINFIKDPTKLRPNTKMPASRYLNDADLDKIIDYLDYMGKKE